MTTLSKYAKTYLEENGMEACKVSWDDTGRDPKSCWGRNITDVKLMPCDGEPQTMIRTKNFKDVTCDIPSDSVRVCGPDGTPVSLFEYLDSIKPGLHCARDSLLLSRAQASFMELDEKEDEVHFTIEVKSYHNNVLFVVATSHGTSYFLPQSRFYFSCGPVVDGMMHAFKAERMKNDDGSVVKNYSDMTDQQKMENAVYIYQIPLKVEEVRPRGTLTSRGTYEVEECCVVRRGGCVAKIGVGKELFRWLEPDERRLVRDETLPIGLTVQYYRISDGEIDKDTAIDIVKKLKTIEKPAVNVGSLVVGDNIDQRPTRDTANTYCKTPMDVTKGPLATF